MKPILLRLFCRSIWGAILGLSMALTGASAFAANAAPAAEPSDRDPEARAILLKMADCIAKAPGFSVTIRSGYDAIQEDGQRIEFGERRKILLQRPDRVRVEVERSDGERGLILFDGKELTAFKAEGNVYARVEKPGTVDDAVVYLVRDLQMTLPLARMLRKDFPQNLDQLITSLSYVEKNALFDVATDHLAARSADVDMQVWIANGQQPLPRRIILTYRNEPGHPQFRADLSDWNLSPKIAAGSFSFTPPLGAERIPFLAPLAQKGSLPMPKGGQK